MSVDLEKQIALTLVPGIGPVQARVLIEHFGSAEDVFKAKTRQLGGVEKIGQIRADAIKQFKDFERAEKELAFAEKHKINILLLNDEAYPKRLRHCYDAPTVLYYRGNADLNAEKVVAIVGTRNHTEYGREVTEQLVGDLAALNVLIVSGLAFGIDAIAHRAALYNGLNTVGALGHGLKTIYPGEHRSLAKEMIEQGGLITENVHDVSPDRHNFPRRNRIVAGMSDLTVIVETAIKGGSMITAEMAFSYNRDVFAVPGRVGDSKSEGSNKLVQQNKAAIFTDVDTLLSTMGWQKKKRQARKQRELFIELTEDEQTIMDILNKKDSVHIDEIYFGNGLTSSSVAAAILNLELQGVIKSLPGKMYALT